MGYILTSQPAKTANIERMPNEICRHEKAGQVGLFLPRRLFPGFLVCFLSDTGNPNLKPVGSDLDRFSGNYGDLSRQEMENAVKKFTAIVILGAAASVALLALLPESEKSRERRYWRQLAKAKADHERYTRETAELARFGRGK